MHWVLKMSNMFCFLLILLITCPSSCCQEYVSTKLSNCLAVVKRLPGPQERYSIKKMWGYKSGKNRTTRTFEEEKKININKNYTNVWKFREQLIGCDRIDLTMKSDIITKSLVGVLSQTHQVAQVDDRREHKLKEMSLGGLIKLQSELQIKCIMVLTHIHASQDNKEFSWKLYQKLLYQQNQTVDCIDYHVIDGTSESLHKLINTIRLMSISSTSLSIYLITTPIPPFDLKKLLISGYKFKASDEDPSTIFWIIMDDVIQHMTPRQKSNQYRTLIIEQSNYLTMIRRGLATRLCENIMMSQQVEEQENTTFVIVKVGDMPIYQINYQNDEFEVKRLVAKNDLRNIDLNGGVMEVLTKQLDVVSILEEPFLMHQSGLCKSIQKMPCQIPIHNGTSEKEEWIQSCCYGYAVDLIRQLEHRLNINVRLYIVRDNRYGAFDERTQSFNGMIGDVASGRAAMAVAGLTITEKRGKFVKFTAPFMQAQLSIFTLKKIPRYEHSFTFLPQIGFRVKVMVACMFLFGGLYLFAVDNSVLWWIHRKTQEERKHYPYSESISHVAGLLCQRDLVGSRLAITSSGKVFSQTWALAFLVANTFITATITTNRIVNGKLVQEFKGLDDDKMLYPTPNFKFGATKDSSSELYFRRKENLTEMYRFMRKYSVDSTEIGIRKLLKGELQAFMAESPMVDVTIAKKTGGRCRIGAYPDHLAQLNYGVAVQKNSGMESIISDVIHKLREDETLRKMYNRWIQTTCLQHVDSSEYEPKHLSTNFFIVMITVGTCLITLGIEWIIYLVGRKRVQSKLKPKEG